MPILLLISVVSYAAVNYSEYFPNGSTVLQSQSAGWTTPMSSSKDIMTPEGCRKITSTSGQMMFIPTRTMAEWSSFRNLPPAGVVIAACVTATRYPGCNIDDITLSNGQVWAACNVGAASSMAYGGYYTYSTAITTACTSGYHVPTKAEMESAVAIFPAQGYNDPNKISTVLSLPLGGFDFTAQQGNSGYYWLFVPSVSGGGYVLYVSNFNASITFLYTDYTNHSISVRCMKN